jgi:hypothetical protein
MVKIIKLRTINGDDIYVNTDSIILICNYKKDKNERGTTVRLGLRGSDGNLNVLQTPEEIMKLIEESNNE